MQSIHRFLTVLVTASVLASCTTTQSTVDEAPATATTVERPPAAPASPSQWDRPFPNPVPVPQTFQRAIASGTRTADGRPGPDYWTQEASYRIVARLDPSSRIVQGEAEIRYRNNSPTALDRLYLELAQNLHAEGVVRNVASEVTGGVQLGRVRLDGVELTTGQTTAPRYTVDGTQLVIHPAQAVRSGEEVQLDIAWEFSVPQQGASGRMGHDADNLFFIAYWYPIMAVFDDVQGWHTAPFRGQAEFYAGFADFDVTVEAPGDWLILATGELQNAADVLAPDILMRMQEAHQSDEPVTVVGPDDFRSNATVGTAAENLRWHFTAEKVRDFSFSATRESVWDAARAPVGDRDRDGQTDFAAINTLYRLQAPLWSDVTRFQQHALSFLSSFTGFPYPWPHMTAVEGGNIIGGGMEFPMMTLMGDYNASGSEALYYVTAHELAHMWIPMIVSNNERRFTWMDEGATTFHENESRRDFMPGQNHHLGDLVTYLGLAATEAEAPMMLPSDFHEDSLPFVVASYMKPSTVLVALRAILGNDVFMDAWQTFIREWAYGHPYPTDFFNAFERASGRDLDWFWRSWYYETWVLDQAVDSVERLDGGITRVRVSDHGDAPMPVLLRLTLEDGSVVEERVPVDVWLTGQRETTVDVSTASPAIRVDIDPEMSFPDIDRSNSVWRRR